MDPVNYAAGIQAGQALVPDPSMQEAQRQLAAIQVQHGNIETQNALFAQQMQQRALQRQGQFAQQMQGFVKNPTAEGLASLTGNFPEFAAQAKDAWGPLNDQQRRTEATQMGEIASLAVNGNPDKAAQLYQAQIDSDLKAGIQRNPQQDQVVLGMLNSKNPAQIKAVAGMAALASGAAVGWDKAGEWLDSLGLSKKLSEQPKLEHVETTNTDGSSKSHVFNPYATEQGAFPEAEGGGQTSGAGPTASPPAAGGVSPAAGAVASTLASSGMPAPVVAGFMGNFHAEGGYNGAQGDGGSASGIGQWRGPRAANFERVIGKPVTEATPVDQAKFVAWEMQNPQAAGMTVKQRDSIMAAKTPAQAAALIDQFYERSSGRDRSVRMAAANAFAANGAPSSAPIAGGQAAAAGAPQAQSSPYTVGGGSGGAINTKGADQSMGWNASHTAEVPIPGGPADPKSYSPQEIDDLARNWIATGPTAFASLGGGMGGGGISQLKKAALARATEMMSQSGITADQLPAIRSKYTALNSSMGQNTQILNMLEASERVLHSNAQQVLSTQQQLVKDNVLNNGSPFQNNANLDLWSHIGSPEVKAHIKAYEDAVNGITQEYTKFMNSANGMGGNAAPSDAARGLAGDLNDTGQGPATMAAHIKQIFIETGNKRAGIQAQNQAIQSKLGSLIGSAPKQQEAKTVTRTGVDRRTGRRVVQYSDGSIAYGN